jgi:soluble cytochrome b562
MENVKMSNKEVAKKVKFVPNPTQPRRGTFQDIRDNALFEVVKKPLVVNTDNIGGDDGGIFAMPDLFGTYPKGGGRCLGAVSRTYDILQPTEFMDTIQEAWSKVCNGLAMPKDVRFNMLKNNSIISVKVPIRSLIHRTDVLGDKTDMFLEFQTAFNGITPTSVSTYLEREICTNGMVAQSNKLKQKFKHTPKANARAKDYASGIDKVIQNLDMYEKYLDKLTEVEITRAQEAVLVQEITGFDITEELEGMHLRRRSAVEPLIQSLELERERTGQTAFGLLQGITYYTNHNSIGSTGILSEDDNTITKYNRSEEYVTFDTGRTVNAKAEKVLTKFLLDLGIEQGELV